jgi:hypothetical protein
MVHFSQNHAVEAVADEVVARLSKYAARNPRHE